MQLTSPISYTGDSEYTFRAKVNLDLLSSTETDLRV